MVLSAGGMQDTHRLFVQGMMSRHIVTEESAKGLYKDCHELLNGKKTKLYKRLYIYIYSLITNQGVSKSQFIGTFVACTFVSRVLFK